jgi:hypothetical protein
MIIWFQHSSSIIAVHGLNGNRIESWTHTSKGPSGEKYMWLKQFLPDDVPEARISTYGYDAPLIKFSDWSNEPIHRHASNLLARLSAYRRRTRVGTSHSQGISAKNGDSNGRLSNRLNACQSSSSPIASEALSSRALVF